MIDENKQAANERLHELKNSCDTRDAAIEMINGTEEYTEEQIGSFLMTKTNLFMGLILGGVAAIFIPIAFLDTTVMAVMLIPMFGFISLFVGVAAFLLFAIDRWKNPEYNTYGQAKKGNSAVAIVYLGHCIVVSVVIAVAAYNLSPFFSGFNSEREADRTHQVSPAASHTPGADTTGTARDREY